MAKNVIFNIKKVFSLSKWLKYATLKHSALNGRKVEFPKMIVNYVGWYESIRINVTTLR